MRYNVAQQLVLLCEALGPDVTRWARQQAVLANAFATLFAAGVPHTCPNDPLSFACCMLTNRTELTPNYVRMLRDSEAEVRVAAAGKVASFAKFLMPAQVRGRLKLCWFRCIIAWRHLALVLALGSAPEYCHGGSTDGGARTKHVPAAKPTD